MCTSRWVTHSLSLLLARLTQLCTFPPWTGWLLPATALSGHALTPGREGGRGPPASSSLKLAALRHLCAWGMQNWPAHMLFPPQGRLLPGDVPHVPSGPVLSTLHSCKPFSPATQCPPLFCLATSYSSVKTKVNITSSAAQARATNTHVRSALHLHKHTAPIQVCSALHTHTHMHTAPTMAASPASLLTRPLCVEQSPGSGDQAVSPGLMGISPKLPMHLHWARVGIQFCWGRVSSLSTLQMTTQEWELQACLTAKLCPPFPKITNRAGAGLKPEPTTKPPGSSGG